MVTLQEIHTILQRLDYPATREEILRGIQALDVPREVLERVQTLPAHRYGSVDAVLDALRGLA